MRMLHGTSGLHKASEHQDKEKHAQQAVHNVQMSCALANWLLAEQVAAASPHVLTPLCSQQLSGADRPQMAALGRALLRCSAAHRASVAPGGRTVAQQCAPEARQPAARRAGTGERSRLGQACLQGGEDGAMPANNQEHPAAHSFAGQVSSPCPGSQGRPEKSSERKMKQSGPRSSQPALLRARK